MPHETPALVLFRGLLCLYPAEFRDHFSREICLVAARRLRERPGLAALASMYLGVLSDAPKEHYHMIRQDVVYALRTMRRQKLSAAAAILVLALGIGSTTTVFTLVDGLLLRPLPYPAQDRLVYVEEVTSDRQYLSRVVAYPNYLDFRHDNRSLEDLALFGSGLATLVSDTDAERIPAGFGTASLFRVLGVRPLLGRTFTVEDERFNGPHVVVLGEDLWRRRYGADPEIVGKTITIGSDQTRVIGVMPQGFHFPEIAEFWVPLQINPKYNTRMDHGLEGIGLLKPGIQPPQAQEDLRAIMARISQQHPTETYGQTVNVSPYRVRDTGQMRPVLLTLLGAVGFVLLIACANTINLLLIKASARAREVAIRGALGASRARLMRQFVVESVMLGAAGALAGIALAWAAIPALLSLVPEQLPRWIRFTPDLRMLAFVVAVTAGTGILAGMVPAFSASRLKLVETLKEGGRSSTSGGAAASLRRALLVAEVAMSMLLLVGAGLMVQTFWKLNRLNAGFRPENVITFQTTAVSNRYDGKASLQLARRIRQEIASLPGVISTAGSSAVPLLDGWGRSFTAEGSPVLSLKDAPMINHVVVTPGYFRTLGIPILEGRDFEETDAKQPLVTILDAGLAKRYWPNESAVGKRVRYGPPEWNEPWHTVIGVVGEARNQSLREPGHHSVYLPNGEFEFSSLAYLVRTGAGFADPAKAIRTRMAQIDRGIAISRMVSLRDVVANSIWQERFFTTVFAFFGGLALLLAVVGLYGVMAYAVSRRTHEMGIRMALGASAREIRKMIWLESGRLVAGGLALGVAAAALLTKLLRSELYDVSPTDSATYAAVAGILLVAAMLASDLPARKATRVDPMTALREE